MARLYEQLFYIADHSANAYAAIPFPSRTNIERIVISGPLAGFNATVYNRLVATPTGSEIAIGDAIEDAVSGNVIFRPTAPLTRYLRVGDNVAVTGTSSGTYDADHIITSISEDGRQILTATAFTAGATGGEIALDLSAGDKKLFELLAQTAATSGVVSVLPDPTLPFVNEDSEHNTFKWTDGVLYLLLSATGAYRISVAGSSDV
jgi:hypothetical protein